MRISQHTHLGRRIASVIMKEITVDEEEGLSDAMTPSMQVIRLEAQADTVEQGFSHTKLICDLKPLFAAKRTTGTSDL